MTSTNLWLAKNGKKYPIQAMDDGHLKSSWKLCWYVVFYYARAEKFKEEPEKVALNILGFWGITMPLDVANKFCKIFDDEVLKRGKRWKKPEYKNLLKYLEDREKSNNYLRGVEKRILKD